MEIWTCGHFLGRGGGYDKNVHRMFLVTNKIGESSLRLLFVLAMEHTLLHMFLNIWHQILFLGNLHDASPLNFCTTECGTLNCLCSLQLPECLSNYQHTFIF